MPQNPMMTKVFFPDACWRPEIISGALFLYFHKGTITFPLHPSVSTFLTGANPLEFFKFVDERAPRWLDGFSAFGRMWSQYTASVHRTSKMLLPLHGKAFQTILFSYPRNAAAWEAAEDLIASSTLSFLDISKLIDPFSAADELFSHIFFETFLELYGSDNDLQAPPKPTRPKPRQVNWLELYQYVDRIFSKQSLQDILTTVYMFRVTHMKRFPAVLLSNPSMVEFFSSLPVEVKRGAGDGKPFLDLDVIGWEFFRQLLSPRIDPLTPETVSLVKKLIRAHPKELEALARKCFSLSQELSDESNLETLQGRIANYIRSNVEKDIEALLFADKAAANDFLDSVFTDAKAWAGIATFLYSLSQGGPLLTAGAAIGTLADAGSKAMKAARDRRKKLESSDYTVLYRIAKSRL